MQLTDVETMARKKMNFYGLGRWKLVLSPKRSFIGQCQRTYYHKNPWSSMGEIRLSIPYMEVLSEAEVLDTILHEIAHALAPRNVKPHGPEWKEIAVRLGARPRANAPVTVPAAKARYMGMCEGGHDFSQTRSTDKLYRRSSYCRTCKKRTGDGTITWTDTATGKVLNPERTPSVQAPVKVAAKTAPKAVSTPVKRPRIVSFKDRYDQGDTSFADVW